MISGSFSCQSVHSEQTIEERQSPGYVAYVKDHLGSGRPHVTNANDDAYIISEKQDMPFKKARMLEDQLHTHNQCQGSIHTIQSCLLAANIIACLEHYW